MSNFDRIDRALRRRRRDLPGVVRWLMTRTRHRLIVAGVFLFAAPALLGAFLWKAATDDKLYTARVPFVVYHYGSGDIDIQSVLAASFEKHARSSLNEPGKFLRSQHWERDGAPGSTRHEFVSVFTSKDIALATETHRQLVVEFAERAAGWHPELKFAAGDEITASNALEIDDSSIRTNTGLSLATGVSAYAVGLTLLAASVLQLRWDFG